MPESTVTLETQFQGDFLEIRDIITRNRKHYPNSIFPSITLDQKNSKIMFQLVNNKMKIETKMYLSSKHNYV